MGDDLLDEWKGLFRLFVRDVNAAHEDADQALAGARALVAVIQPLPFVTAGPFINRLQALEQRVVDSDNSGASSEERCEALVAVAVEAEALSDDIEADVKASRDAFSAALGMMIQTLQDVVDDGAEEAWVRDHARTWVADVQNTIDTASPVPAEAARAFYDKLLNDQPGVIKFTHDVKELKASFGALDAYAQEQVGAVRTAAGRVPILTVTAPFEAAALAIQGRVADVLATTTYAERRDGVAALETDFGALLTHISTLTTTINDARRKIRTLENILAPYEKLKEAKDDLKLIAESRKLNIESINHSLAGAAVAQVDALVNTWTQTLDSDIRNAETLRNTHLDIGKTLADIETLERGVGAAMGTCQAAVDVREELATEQMACVQGRADIVDTVGSSTQKAARAVALARRLRALLARLSKLEFDRLATEVDGAARIKAIIDDIETKDQADPAQDIIARQAIETVFGVTLTVEANLETKWMPKLFDLLYDLPRHQVRQDKFKRLEYGVEPRDKHNYYQGATQLIALNNLDETGETVPFHPDNPTPAYKRPFTADDAIISNHDVEYYTSTVLHEVGHAVDDLKKYMEGKKENATFGGWKKVSIGDVADAFGTERDFYKTYAKGGVTQDVLKGLLISWLQGHDPAQPPSISAKAWSSITKDKVVAACKAARSEETPWYKGKKGAETLKAGAYVYQESYAGDWQRYSFAARAATGVSEYQWRADGEWFAEIYAMHALGKLRGNHPMHAELDTLAANP